MKALKPKPSKINLEEEFNAKTPRRQDATRSFGFAPLRLCVKSRLPALLTGIGALILILCALRSFADLTVTVQPGYTFATGERPDTAKLNRLGQPTITISGTVGGTNAGLAAGSVNGVHLADTLLASNLTWDTSSPRKIAVTNGGIYSRSINTAALGTGLFGGDTGGAGVPITVTNIPVNRISIASNSIVIGGSGNVGTALPLGTNFTTTDGSLNLSSNALAGISGFVTAEYPLAVGLMANTNHGLGMTPGQTQWALICKTNGSAGYTEGDEIALFGIQSSSDNMNFISGANSSNVFLVAREIGTSVQILNKTNGVLAVFTAAHWRAKGYAKP